jgi:cell division protein FtsN
MIEYLEITLLITAIIVVFRQTHEKIKDIENQAKNIERKLDEIEKLLVKRQPKDPVEIPVRLDDEVVNVMTEMTKKEMLEYQKEKIEFQKKQRKLLKDMMSADEKLELYDKDDIEEMKIWDATLMDGMDDTQYEGTEYGGPDRLTREQAQEMLARAKYRKANKLK